MLCVYMCVYIYIYYVYIYIYIYIELLQRNAGHGPQSPRCDCEGASEWPGA